MTAACGGRTDPGGGAGAGPVGGGLGVRGSATVVVVAVVVIAPFIAVCEKASVGVVSERVGGGVGGRLYAKLRSHRNALAARCPALEPTTDGPTIIAANSLEIRYHYGASNPNIFSYSNDVSCALLMMS